MRIVILLMLVLFLNVSLANKSESFDYYQSVNSVYLHKIETYHLPRAEKLWQDGKLTYAFSEFAYVLYHFPNHPIALQKLSELCLYIKQPQKALEYFDQAVKLYPTHAPTYALYGKLLMDLQQFEPAILQYQQATLFDPNNPEYHYQLGLAYFNCQKFELANKEAQDAYQLGYAATVLKEKLITVDAWKPVKKHS